MGLRQGDYWVSGLDLPSLELVTDLEAQLAEHHPGSRAATDTAALLWCLTRARELTDALADVSTGYGYDLGNNLDGSGGNTARAVADYERGHEASLT